MKNIEIYTDGACSGNPGPGGYGIVLKYNNIQKEYSGYAEQTTNNRKPTKQQAKIDKSTARETKNIT